MTLSASRGVVALLFSGIFTMPGHVGAQQAVAAVVPDQRLAYVSVPSATATGATDDPHVPPGTRRPRSTRGNLAIVGAVEATAFAITWVLPDDVSKWDKSIPPSYYLRRAYTHAPVWDRDHFFWNWIIHPVAGQQAYLLERNEGRGPWRGFVVATAASVGWEYGFEAFIERPSAQDLLITSPVGAALGELSWQATRRLRRNGVHGAERVALLVANPGWVMRWGFR